ncbi:MAG TPA: TetR/AcrR family transcriptional regulator [Pseudonocardiaceae bacterium]|jgi:AcrR family transcriptional regulator|nr:TetR/AcrR family transcriptional regulator [Pseudonocardiaceae bacterium]
MTNQATARPGKRDRLIAAARATLYAQGVERTTLADIAEAADVPVGNVYYYFKTKAELVSSVVEGYQTLTRDNIATLNRRRTPRARLHGLIEIWLNQRESLTAHGCPVGTLSTELDKTADPLARDSAGVLGLLLDWIEGQFREAGRRDARELAVALLSAYEGVAVLANVLGDEALITMEGKRLQRWIDALT